MTWPAGLAAISGAVGVGAGIASAFTGGKTGVKTTFYDQLRQQAERQLWLEGRQYQEQMERSKNFGEMASNMGVSRYALLGNMPAVNTPTLSAIPQQESPSRGSRVASAMQQMGQDAQRGLQTYMGLKEMQSTIKLRESQAKLNNAQASNLINESQKPKTVSLQESDLPSDYIIRDKQLKKQGLSKEDQIVVTRTGKIRYYPSQDIQDYISESVLGEGLYMKGKWDYTRLMNAGDQIKNKTTRFKDPAWRAYQASKNELESRLGKRVKWVQITRYDGHWQVIK